ncbi:hypothetical protein BC835DRAFT_1413370 [Cytidiella melzeri]|nr:hypothetical protein BC835DRAFT_1413370 [Cytidiella melzeri]
MSHPTLIVRAEPKMFSRQYELDNFLCHGSWPKAIATENNTERVTRANHEHTRAVIQSEMLTDRTGLWHELLGEWTAWCLGDYMLFENAVNTFIEYTYKRHVVVNHAPTEKLDLEGLRYLRQVSKDMWEMQSRPTKQAKRTFQHHRREGFSNETQFTMKCDLWKKSLEDFFYSNDTVGSYQFIDQLLPLRAACLDTVTQMRKIRKSVYSTDKWRQVIATTGLVRTLLDLAAPGRSYQLSPAIIDTCNIGLWRDTLGELVHAWTPTEAFKMDVVKTPAVTVDNSLTPSGNAFIDILRHHPTLVPNVGNCLAVFFLNDESSFVENWKEWLVYGLVGVGYHEALKNKTDLPPTLQRIFQNSTNHKNIIDQFNSDVHHSKPSFSSKPLSKVIPPPSAMSASQPKPPSSLRAKPLSQKSSEPVVINFSHAITDDWRPFPNHEAHDTMPRGTCRMCQDLPVLERCIRRYDVSEYPEATTLTGAVLTYAMADDRIGVTNSAKALQYRSPDDPTLQFVRIEHRPEVYRRCGRDANIFIHTDRNVGGVVYNAFTPSVLNTMKKSHALVMKNKSIKRGSSFQVFAASKMVPVGTRQPQGGSAGDGYAPYTHMAADSPEAIDALMSHALDADLLLTAVRPYNHSVAKTLDKLTKEAGLSKMGSKGVNQYYCSNYIAPLHADNDMTTTLCCQLEKQNTKHRELDFCYSKYGFYVETVANMAWWFESSDLHGSIVPAQSSVANMSKNMLVLWRVPPPPHFKDVPTSNIIVPLRIAANVTSSVESVNTSPPHARKND